MDREPAEGEVYLFTTGGNFVVKGTAMDVARRLASEEWPTFELAESGDTVIMRSSQVVAIRAGTKRTRRSAIGFTHAQ